VDHIGSLVRPAGLKAVLAKYDHGWVSAEELHKVQDEAVRDVIGKQEAHGMPVVNDGEFRRHNFQESFSACVEGYDVPQQPYRYYDGSQINKNPLERAEQDFDAAGPAILTRRKVVNRLRLVRNVTLEEFQFNRVAQRFKWEESKAVYKGLDDFVDDVVAIERRMVSELVEAGCRYIQIDAPGYTAYVDRVSLERMRSCGEDPEKNMERSIEADNAVINGFPDVTFGIHLCRGNARTIDPKTGKLVAQWHREGHYDAIAERLFGNLKHQRILLEYDSDRAGSFEPIRFVPKDKVVVLGLVTTKSPDIESSDELKRRIEEASRYLPVDQLAISPQCGFGSGGLSGSFLSEEVQWAKLDRIVETASWIWN
jgi:5-methyltetrahydropteroyltriglutamate--homocysteine methyltransferase